MRRFGSIVEAPSVALVIPCHNHADTLARAVGSGLHQTALQEILVVDDCSTDRSPEVCADLTAADSHVRLLKTSQNLGPGGARNFGASASSASYICFLDADDELIGDFFGDALAVIAANPEVRLVKGEMEFFDPVKGYILPEFDPRHKSAVLSSSCGTIMARELFLRIGGFPEDDAFRGPSGGEDVAFMQAVIAHCQPIGRVGRPCYRVWSYSGSHVDRFLANTRLERESFEFVHLHPDQVPRGALARALEGYLDTVARRVRESAR